MKSGRAMLDFGTGAVDASIAVALPTITADDVVSAHLSGVTSDHSADEHMIERITVRAGSIVAGTGFTIRGVLDGPGAATGKYLVAWTVNTTR